MDDAADGHADDHAADDIDWDDDYYPEEEVSLERNERRKDILVVAPHLHHHIDEVDIGSDVVEEEDSDPHHHDSSDDVAVAVVVVDVVAVDVDRIVPHCRHYHHHHHPDHHQYYYHLPPVVVVDQHPQNRNHLYRYRCCSGYYCFLHADIDLLPNTRRRKDEDLFQYCCRRPLLDFLSMMRMRKEVVVLVHHCHHYSDDDTNCIPIRIDQQQKQKQLRHHYHQEEADYFSTVVFHQILPRRQEDYFWIRVFHRVPQSHPVVVVVGVALLRILLLLDNVVDAVNVHEVVHVVHVEEDHLYYDDYKEDATMTRDCDSHYEDRNNPVVVPKRVYYIVAVVAAVKNWKQRMRTVCLVLLLLVQHWKVDIDHRER